MLGYYFKRAVSYAKYYLIGTDVTDEKQAEQGSPAESPTSANTDSMKRSRKKPSLTISTDWRSSSQLMISKELAFYQPEKSEAAEACLALALGEDNLFDGLPTPLRDASMKSFQAACDSTLAVHGEFLNGLAKPLSSRKAFEKLLVVESGELTPKPAR